MTLKTQIRNSLGDVNAERVKRVIARIGKPGRMAVLNGLKMHPGFELTKFTRPGQEVYFGYYDKRQLSLSGQRLLAGSVGSRCAQMYEPTDPLELGYFDTSTRNFHCLNKTVAYNWQQGCMLRWLPNCQDRKIAFNDYRSRRFVTVIIDSDSGQQLDEKPYPAYDFSPSGGMIATCDFSRLHHCRRGYGYWQICQDSSQEPPRDGSAVMVRIHDAERDQLVRAIELEEIRAVIGGDVDLKHAYVNHLNFSPSSTKLLFFFFWQEAANSKMAVLFYDIDTDTVRVLTRNYTSHFCWQNDDTLVAWGEDDTGRQSYYRYCVPELHQSDYWYDAGNTDGHCTIVEDATMLTDTYPDECGFQRLYTRDSQGRIETLADIHSPAKFIFDLRCDLHPRGTNQPGTYTFDSAVGGRRATYLIARR